MKKIFGLAALALAAAAPVALAQDTGDWLVRGRAMHLDSANKGDIDGLSVNNKTFPEVDITYFFTPNWATELVLTYPQKHDVRLNGTKIGTVKHLPPTLSLQYHFTGLSGFRPYLGAGVNYTRFSSVDILNGDGSIETDSFGFAYGVGVDVALGGGWLVNVDLKKVQIRTDVGVLLDESGGRSSPKGLNPAHTNLGEFRIDPLLFSIGIGKRF